MAKSLKIANGQSAAKQRRIKMNCILQKKINEKYQKEKIEVLEYTLMKNPAKVKCLKCNSEYKLTRAENFIRKEKTCICKKCVNNHNGGRLDINSFQKKIDIKYPKEKLLVLNYSLKNKPCSIKCLKCNKIITLQNAESFLNSKKERVCSNCFKNKRKIIKNTIKKFRNWMSEQNSFVFCFPFPQEIKSTTLLLSKCKKCGSISKKTMYDYMAGKGCSVCKKNTLKTLNQFQSEVGEEYKVLEYNGMNNASPRGYSCPRCKGSKGEKKIRYILMKNNIKFEEQKIWKIKGHNLRTDFYLPSFGKVIEFNGKQHYEPIGYFGGEEIYKKQVLYDNMKKEFFGENLIIIPYYDYDKIEDIITIHFL